MINLVIQNLCKMDAYILKCIACDQQKFPDYQSVQQIITAGLCMYDLIETYKLKYIFTITFCEEHLVIEISSVKSQWTC